MKLYEIISVYVYLGYSYLLVFIGFLCINIEFKKIKVIVRCCVVIVIFYNFININYEEK